MTVFLFYDFVLDFTKTLKAALQFPDFDNVNRINALFPTFTIANALKCCSFIQNRLLKVSSTMPLTTVVKCNCSQLHAHRHSTSCHVSVESIFFTFGQPAWQSEKIRASRKGAKKVQKRR